MKSIAAARMWSPIDVRSSSSDERDEADAATTIATIVILRMSRPPIVTGRLSVASDAAGFAERRRTTGARSLWSRKATAKVATSITAGDCVRSGRKTSRSSASESASTTAKQRTMPAQTGQSHSDASASANAPAMTAGRRRS